MVMSGAEVGAQLCKDWGLKGVRDMVIRLPLEGVASIEMNCLMQGEQAPFVAEVLKTYTLVPRAAWIATPPGALQGGEASPLCWTWDGVNISLHYWGGQKWTKPEGGQPLRPILAWQMCPAPQPPQP